MDDFKTVTFRLDRGSRTAASDYADLLHYGDSLKVVVTGVAGIDLDHAVLGIFERVAGASAFLNDGGNAAGDFEWMAGSSDAVYATVALTSARLKVLTEAAIPGTPVTVRIYLTDGAVTWLDQAMEILPSPVFSGTAPTSTTGSVFVTTAALHDAAVAVAAMPSATPAEREAKLNRLLSLLGGLYTP
jgi:hypothetical protein